MVQLLRPTRKYGVRSPYTTSWCITLDSNQVLGTPEKENVIENMPYGRWIRKAKIGQIWQRLILPCKIVSF